MKTIPEIVNFYNDSEIYITSENLKNFTFYDLKNQVDWLKNFFCNNGVKKTDKVAIVLENGPELATCFIATASNCCAAPLNPTYTESEFDFYLKDLKPKAIIVKEKLTSSIKNMAIKRGIKLFELIVDNNVKPGKFTLKSTNKIKTSHRIKNIKKILPEDIALILHTSGTTSKPKMVPLTHFNLCTSAKNIINTLNLKRSDKCINMMPLFHIHGIVCLLLAPLLSGGSLLATNGFNALKFFVWLKEFSPTWLSAVPTMYQTILARASRNSEILSSSKLRFIRSSSAPLPSITMKEIENTFNCPVIESYGMTEAAHQMTSNHLPPGKRKLGKAGFAAGPKVEIIDKNNNILTKGNIGEIVIKGNNVTKGYLKNTKANKVSFIKGWFLTGDEGFFNEEGFLQITGRTKEIINKGGEKISPMEIEEAIMKHKFVFQAVTFSMPHEILGEEIASAIVLKNNNVLTELELKEFLSKELAPFKIPKKIIFLDEIPKGKTGKLQRIGLAKKLDLK